MSKLRRLSLIYMSVLAALLSCVVATMIVTEMTAVRLELDTAAIEQHLAERIELLQTSGRVSTIFALAIVIVGIQFVFLPGHRLIGNSMSELREHNERFAEAKEAMSATNAKLSRQADALLDERSQLEQSLMESEALRAEQAAFTYALSHDLKSPTNTLHLLLEELALTFDDGRVEDAKALIDHGRSALRRMNTQVEDVLDFAQVSERKAKPEDIDVKELVNEIRLTLAADIAFKDAKVAHGPVVPIRGIRSQIFCLVQNLVANAIKYSKPGARPEIKVSCVPLADGSGVRLIVADNGIGIAPEHHEKIFGLFQRLHLQSEYPGTGLGLSTCARVAWNHNGDIAVTSELGRGAIFKVTLRMPKEDVLRTSEAA